MRKYVIYCLVAMLLVGLVPIGASAAEDDSVYKVVIYPNGKGIQAFGSSEENLMLGDVEISYDVDYEKNIVEVYFSKPVFIDDVISEGNTIHKNIKFSSEEECREVNKELVTSGFMCGDVSNISLDYEDVNNVDSITILVYELNSEHWIGLLNTEYFDKEKSNINSKLYDDNIDSYWVYKDSESTWVIVRFKTLMNITGIRLKLSRGSMVVNGKNCYSGYNSVDFKGVDRLDFDLSRHISVYEMEIFGEPFVIGEVTGIDYTMEGNNITLTWENPEDIIGVNIYRNGELIEGNYVGEIYDDEDLEPGTYEYKVTTVDEFGNESEGVTVNVIVEKLPEEVKGLDYIVEDDNVILTWTNPESEDFEGVNIYRDEELIETTTEESFSESLPSGGIYQYRITTLESGKESPGITIDVLVQSAPTTVKNMRMINRTATGGSVTWDLNPAFENVEKYIVYVNGEKHGETEAPPYPLEGLEEGKTYTISVQAVNSYGISEPPATVIFTPSELSEIGNSIKVGDIFSYVAMLFKNMWPLLAIALAILLTPKVIQMIKSSTG